MKLTLRSYKCEQCGKKSMHTTNHHGDILVDCVRECGEPTRHTYVEDVRVITLDATKTLTEQIPDHGDARRIMQLLGHIVPADHGRRVYLTHKSVQFESMEQFQKRKRMVLEGLSHGE